MQDTCSGNCIICGKCLLGPVLEESGKSMRGIVPRKGYGLAVDIGTTTVVLALINLATGKIVARHSFVNPQRVFGPDVISRINAANNGHLSELGILIKQSISSAITTLLSAGGVSQSEVVDAAIAGNTVMVHLLLGIPCESLGVAPFKPTYTLEKAYRDLFPETCLDCSIFVMPWLAGYVGGDVMAGLIHVAPEGKSRFLLMDIGTNGEIALYDNGRLLVTATAAGPAFELPVRDSEYFLGASGVISALAGIVREEIVDESGFMINEGLFTQKQVRDLQLAKSAIRSGLEILLEIGGCAYTDLEAVYLAGGIGQAMNIEDAACIGLIPHKLKSISIPVGNASLGGASAYLTDTAMAAAEIWHLQNSAKEINLAANANFNDYFMEYMLF